MVLFQYYKLEQIKLVGSSKIEYRSPGAQVPYEASVDRKRQQCVVVINPSLPMGVEAVHQSADPVEVSVVIGQWIVCDNGKQ